MTRILYPELIFKNVIPGRDMCGKRIFSHAEIEDVKTLDTFHNL